MAVLFGVAAVAEILTLVARVTVSGTLVASYFLFV